MCVCVCMCVVRDEMTERKTICTVVSDELRACYYSSISVSLEDVSNLVFAFQQDKIRQDKTLLIPGGTFSSYAAKK